MGFYARTKVSSDYLNDGRAYPRAENFSSTSSAKSRYARGSASHAGGNFYTANLEKIFQSLETIQTTPGVKENHFSG